MQRRCDSGDKFVDLPSGAYIIGFLLLFIMYEQNGQNTLYYNLRISGFGFHS